MTCESHVTDINCDMEVADAICDSLSMLYLPNIFLYCITLLFFTLLKTKKTLISCDRKTKICHFLLDLMK